MDTEENNHSASRATIVDASIFSTCKDLGNSDIIEMLGAKLPEKTIITIIESSTVNVDTSAEAIAKLRAAGSSDALIAVIFKVAFKPQTAPISQPVADSKKDNFLSDARILLIQDGKNIDLVAESLTIRNAISSLFTFTPKRYADFRPLNASMRVDSPSPIFRTVNGGTACPAK